MPDVMKTVGRYEILREVGRGGMAMVYLARQTDLDRFVALKELGAFHASDPSFAQRFLRESRVAGSLSHPNIVTVHDYFEYEGTPYIAMEYIERGSLRPYVGHMTLAQIGGVLEGLLAGLAHGEQHGIVHRDLKPENLMVTSDGRVKIADFGIAKATNQMQTGAFLTATGTTVGTPTYMAPEQAMAQDIGPSTDLYSVGCMAFEMFTGRVPFHDTEAPMAILLRHVNEPIPPARSVDPKIDQDISDWIERLLIKDPGQRTQSANEAWDQFEETIIGLLGPRWRREARLREGSQQLDTPPPLTPAPFEGTTSDAAVSDEFQSFAWGSAVTPEESVPGPATPPPSASLPVPPDPVVGPPTPLPSQAVPAAGAPAPEAPPEEDEGFVTFGAPAAAEPPAVAAGEPLAAEGAAPAPPPSAEAPPVAAGDPVAAEPEAPAPAAEAPAVASGDPLAGTAPSDAPPSDVLAGAPVAQPTEPVEEEEEAFETYIAPAPLRPPTEDAPPDAPALPPEPPVVAPPPVEEPAAAAPAPAPTPPAPTPTPAPPPVPVAHDDELAPTVMPASVKAPPPPTPPRVAPAPPREEPKPEPVPAREKSNKGVLIGFGVAAVIVAVLGLMVGRGGGGGDEGGGGAPTAAQRNAQLEVSFPAGWAKLGSPPEIPGMELSEPVALAPDGAAGGESVVFGTVKDAANNSTLLPTGLLTALGLDSGEFPRREAVRLASSKVEAYRYTNLRPEGLGQPVTIFAAPTSEGVATLACVKPGPDCEAIANTLKISSGTPFPVGPSKAYATSLGKELGALNKTVKSGAAKLKAAKTGKAQAAAANTIAGAYEKASANLSKAEVSPADQAANAQLVAALKETGRGYERLASAASKNDRAGYRRASTAISRGEQAVDGAVRGLQAAGYKIGG